MKIISEILAKKKNELQHCNIMSIINDNNRHDVSVAIDMPYNILLNIKGQIPLEYSGSLITEKLIGIKDVQEDKEKEYVYIFKHNKCVKKDIEVFFDNEIIAFDFDAIAKSRSFTLYKIVSIMYQWIKTFAYDLSNVYTDMLSSEEEYMLDSIQNTCNRNEVENYQERYDDFLNEKAKATNLHNILIRYYTNQEIDIDDWRRVLRGYMEREPKYARLIAAFLSLINIKDINITKDCQAFTTRRGEENIHPLCFLWNYFIEEYDRSISDGGEENYYAVISKRRKFYFRLKAFLLEFNKI